MVNAYFQNVKADVFKFQGGADLIPYLWGDILGSD